MGWAGLGGLGGRSSRVGSGPHVGRQASGKVLYGLYGIILVWHGLGWGFES